LIAIAAAEGRCRDEAAREHRDLPELVALPAASRTFKGKRACGCGAGAASQAGIERRHHRVLLVAATMLVGVFTGLLANGGAFLLVPMYLLIFGLNMREAAGTSLLVVAVLAIPTLAAHWALGHIDWMPALTVFGRAGFRLAQMDDIAAEMGVAKGTLYGYVDSKEAMFALYVIESVVWFASHRLGDPDSADIDSDLARADVTRLLISALIPDAASTS